MFDTGFPQDWSTLKKLIWLKATTLSASLVTLTGSIVSFIANQVASVNSIIVNINQSATGCNVYVDSDSMFYYEAGVTVITNNKYLKAGGSLQSSNTWLVTDYLPVSVGDYVGIGLSISGSGTYSCIYNSDKEFIRSVEVVANQDQNLTIAEGEAFVRLSIRKGDYEYETAKFVRRETYAASWTDVGSVSSGTVDIVSGELKTGGNTYQLTGQTVSTLEGANNISSDLGDVSVTIPSSILTDENPVVNVGTTDNMVLTE